MATMTVQRAVDEDEDDGLPWAKTVATCSPGSGICCQEVKQRRRHKLWLNPSSCNRQTGRGMSERQSPLKVSLCSRGRGTVLQRSYEFHVDRPKDGWVDHQREAAVEIDCPDCRPEGCGLPAKPIEIPGAQACSSRIRHQDRWTGVSQRTE
jgi:hypothetical protein